MWVSLCHKYILAVGKYLKLSKISLLGCHPSIAYAFKYPPTIFKYSPVISKMIYKLHIIVSFIFLQTSTE